VADAVLVFVAGASPQIITETVWALTTTDCPTTDVYVLTTARGRDAIAAALLGHRGQWRRLVTAYPRARRFRLGARNVIVLHDGRGRPLEDVRSSEDNRAAADQIVRFVAEHTREGAPPLHASIAGGRKTMGYLLAAALMLYGRPEDRLSHVLIRPSALEGTDFHFPPRRAPAVLTHRRADGTIVRVPARDVRIELADLPFPRLRAVGDISRMRDRPFSVVVQELQEDLARLVDPHVEIDSRRGTLSCGELTVRLSPLRAALYTELAERRRSGCGQPACEGCPVCFLPATEIRERLAPRLRERMIELGSPGVEVRAGHVRWAEKQFREERSKINRDLQRALRGAAGPYQVRAIGSRKARLYGLGLSPERIRIAGSPAGAGQQC